MARSSRDDHQAVVKRINATLEGPVADVLAELVPELRSLPRQGLLEAVLDDVQLLSRCFNVFNANQQKFRHLLVDRHKVPVEDADAVLQCGRSLEEVVAMIVRTAAKRHFRRRLDGQSRPLRISRSKRGKAPARMSLFARLAAVLSSSPPHTQAPGKSKGERLYEVFQDYLRHDWQVALVPEYSNLPPSLVRELGPRILDYRIPEDLRKLKYNPKHQPTPLPAAGAEGAGPSTAADQRPAGPGMAPPPQAAEAAARDERARFADILTTDGKRLKAAAFTAVLVDPQVRAAIPQSDQTVRATATLAGVGGLVAKQIVGELGLNKEQLAVFLMTASDAMGDKAFERAFGVPGHPEYIGKLLERAKIMKIDGKSSLPDIAAFIAAMFKGASKAK